jgi:hypothetical protein
MAAIDVALGAAQRYVVVAPSGMIESLDGTDEKVTTEPWWVDLLRAASGMDRRVD